MEIRAFIQARMSSKRFPGKVLAPLSGRPIIAHVIDHVSKVVSADGIVVATSTDQSDDPLACYVRHLGFQVFRGPLENVFRRFHLCLREYPCRWFFRVCADSPALDIRLLRQALAMCVEPRVDLITNVFPRTFPKGRSVELINAESFYTLGLDREMNREEKEHVTKVFYDHPSEFMILNFESGDPSLINKSFAVDRPEDLDLLAQSLSPAQARRLRS